MQLSFNYYKISSHVNFHDSFMFLGINYCLVLISCLVSTSNCVNVINIAGLYPRDGNLNAPQMRSIGEFAKDLINNSTLILPDYQLSIDWKNSQCKRETAVGNIIDFVKDSNVIYHFVLGPACSISAEPVGEIIPHYDLNMLSYSSTSPALTSSTYPNTFLGVVTYNTYIVVYVKLIEFFQWRRVALIAQDTEVFNTINLNFAGLLNHMDIAFDIARVGGGSGEQIDVQLDRIFGSLKYKIAFANFYQLQAYEVLCRAYKKGYVYPYVTWVFPSWYGEGWIDKGKRNCDFCQGCDIEAALRGSLGVDSLATRNRTLSVNNDTILGFKQQEIWDMFTENNIVTGATLDKYLPFVFDSLLSIAIAMNMSIQNGLNLTQFNYHDPNNTDKNAFVAEFLRTSLSSVDFKGLTGQVIYENRARKFSNAELSEYKGNGSYEPRITIPNVGGDLSMGVKGSDVNFNEVEYEYFGKQTDDDPLDGVELHHLPTPALALSVILAIIALIFSGFFLVFNIIFHKKKVIRYSNPILNAMILIGACLQCGVAILVLIDNRIFRRTPEQQNDGVGCFGCTLVCHLVWWVPALATDIIFGTLIGKSVRIYSIVVRKTLENKIKLIYIILAIGVLMLFDTVYTIIWAAIEELRFQFIAVGPEKTDLSSITQPGSPFWYIFYCAEGGDPTSPAIAVRFVYILFRWILYAMGLYFAFQIREVQIRGVNEFQAITLATFVTIFFNLVRIILITMIPSVRLIDSAITLLSMSYSLDTICVVGFIFVPKLYFIIQDPHQKKNYTGVNHNSSIENTSIHKMQISKIQDELETIKVERDNLLTKVALGSDFSPLSEGSSEKPTDKN